MFRELFNSPYDQYEERIGQPFKVIRQLEWDEIDDVPEIAEHEVGRMYLIEFEDKEQIHAWPEEVEAGIDIYGKSVEGYESDVASGPCRDCHKAGWIDMHGKMIWGCDMSHCIADPADDVT